MSDLVEIGGLRGDRAKCYRHGAEITEGDHVLVIVALDGAGRRRARRLPAAPAADSL